MTPHAVSIRTDAEVGTIRMPSEKDVLDCLRRLGAPEARLSFKAVAEFRAPGVYDQVHLAAGSSSLGAIRIEEEERGAGTGETAFLFNQARGLELYLTLFSGSFRELAVLARIDPASADAVKPLFDAMGIAVPAAGGASPSAADRLALHERRLESLKGHAQEWLKP